MEPERWAKIEKLYHEALELEPDQRAAFLDKVSAGDVQLRQEVGKLLSSHEAGTLIQEPALEVAAKMAAEDSVQLKSGQVITSYEILNRIGVGGMGEVYRARDKKLGREVAIKVLPPAFSQDRERLSRFQREARLLAALNHPNIAAIYGLEESEGMPFLVLELVAGETLAQRLKEGRLPVEEALRLCCQIAEGLESAHEKGIMHRDLKPANIKITPEGKVKILDFGLAKALEGERPQKDPSQFPTDGAGTTETGVILGTAAYMSPEQARGKRVDKRTDIWAFGCVLYECLTGNQPFSGATATDILAAIMNQEVDFQELSEATPVPIKNLLRRCLLKEHSKRLRDIGDAHIEIEEALADPKGVLVATDAVHLTHQSKVRLVAPWALVTLVVGAVIASFLVWNLKPQLPEQPRPITRFTITEPESGPLMVSPHFPDLAISRDGMHVVYPSQVGSRMQCYLRTLDQLEAIPIRGTEEGAGSFFFSPDGTQLGFILSGTLKKVPIQGGVSQAICEVSGIAAGGTWRDDGTIVVGRHGAGLLSVPATGGEPQLLTFLDPEKGENGHVWPEFLPGGKALLFTILAGERWESVQIAALDLESTKHHVLLPGGNPHSSPTGHLVYGRDGAIWAVAFDPTKLKVIGESVPVLDVVTKSSGAANFSFSDNGSLAYVSRYQEYQRILVWVDRDGNVEPVDIDLRQYASLSLSPDGKRVAAKIYDKKNPDLWILDLKSKTNYRLTRHPQSDDWALWTPEAERIVFASNRQDTRDLYWKASDGTDQAELLAKSPRSLAPESWSADGKMLVIAEWGGGNSDIGVLSMEGEHSKRLLLHEEFNETNPAISPDGKWMAYASDESGQYEIYVRPFPNVDEGKWTISRGGGTRPVWAPDGRELFFRNGDKMIAAPVTTGASFSHGISNVLFEGRYWSGAPGTGPTYDISPDGQRFLMIKEAPQTEETSALTDIIIVQNWFEELKRLVPTDN